MPQLTTTDGVHVIDLGPTENRFSPDWMSEVEAALDAVVAAPAPLVVHGSGRFFSNGLDLDWVLANGDQLPAYTTRVEAILARLLTLPVPTAAAVNGHAFGAGAMLALALDWRVMREDRGFFCLPEVDIQIPFTPGMAALIQSKLTPRTAVDTMTTGRRFDGGQAREAGIVDALASEDELLAAAVGLVAPLAGKSADTLGRIKAQMFSPALSALTAGDAR